MKYKAKDYARAIAGVKKFDPKVFLRLLEKNGDLKKAKAIIAELEKLNHRKVVIETARKTKTTWDFGKNDIVEEKVNLELVAGAKITINGEKQIDFSLKNKLEKIFNV